MKKQYVNSVSILFAILCLAFTACNGMLTGGDTGTVRVVIGGGTARSVDGKGLPALNEKNTVITITDEEGTALARETTSVTVTLPIGTKITVKAVVTTAAGEWHGSEKHTVTAGDNFIAVKLSKTLKVAANLLVSITGKHHLGSNIVSLSTQNGKKLLDGILIGKKPVTARDKIGRIYVLYEDTSSTHLKRFDVEGNEDTPISFADGTWASILSNPCIDSAVDVKTDTLFLAMSTPTGKVIYYTNKENGFVPSTAVNITTIDSAILNIHALAVYNNMVYLVVTRTTTPSFCLMAYQAALSGSTLTLTHKATQELSKLRSASAFGNDHTVCTGLFADDDGVYCLLAQNNTLFASISYAVGTLIRYEYSGSTLTKKAETGLNPVAPGSDRPIPFDDQYFFYPTGFIGYDEENIYIADDGFGIQYKNENWHFKGNKNRIAAFNRKTKTLTFSDTGATWYDEKPKYPSSTKTLLWGKDENQEFRYWTSEDGTEAFSGRNKLFEYSPSPTEKPTDIFCYDQDGNLYILWKDGPDYKVRRFALKEDGSYDTQGVDLTLTAYTVPAIAVDVSDGKNYLYYAYKDGPNKHIQRYSWNSTSFNTATLDSTYGVHINSQGISFTALAANKDGLFVGVKETYQHDGIDKYRLKVQKYKKSDASFDSELTLVDNAPEYTDSSGNPIDYGSFTDNIRIQYMEAINDLQVFDGVLYALSSKSRETQNKDGFPYYTDAFKNSGVLYKIGSTNGTLSGNAVVLAKKDWNDTNKIGYGFYRFIALKYDEAERIKLIIASDGAWDENGIAAGQLTPKPPVNNIDKILEYDLAGSLRSERNSGGSFSKTLKLGSGFDW